MKKTFFITLFALLASTISNKANAGTFFALRGGAEKLETKITENSTPSVSAFIFGASLGYHYSFFRLEAEYMYHGKKNFDNNLDTTSHSAMGNLYFSPPMKSVVRPYLMGGIGAAFHSTELASKEDSNTALAWHVGIGLELEFTENVFLEAGARYVNMGEAELEKDTYEIDGFNYFGGLRFEY